MTRHLLIIMGAIIRFGMLLVAAMTAIATPLDAGETRPNILFIFSDDHATQACLLYTSPSPRD